MTEVELADTVASLTMGVGSLIAPFVATRLLDPVTPGRGRGAKVLMGVAVTASALTTVADVVRRGRRDGAHRGHDLVGADQRHQAVRADAARPRHGPVRERRRAARVGRRLLLEPPLQPREPVAVGDARGAPQQRALQPLHSPAPTRRRGADDERAVRSARPGRGATDTPSHHRVHHGTNRQYLDRNHGSILILWDRLFGTFEREDERVVYGLTTNIDTFNPVTIATHEWRDIGRDIAGAATWRERCSFLLRGPGWAYDRRAELRGPGDTRDALAA